MSTLAPLSPPHGPEIPTETAARGPATARLPPAAAPPPAPATPNPSLRLDPALGLVVLEFRDHAGRTATLPTERELAAYRQAGGSPAQPQPGPGGTTGPAAAEG